MPKAVYNSLHNRGDKHIIISKKHGLFNNLTAQSAQGVSILLRQSNLHNAINRSICDIILSMNTTKRPYRKITAQTVARHRAQVLLHGNGSRAVDYETPGYQNPGDRAWHIQKKSEGVATSEFIDQSLQQIGVDAINRLGDLVNSTDERVAMKSVTYTIDHIRGQATKKSISITGKLNIQSVLD